MLEDINILKLILPGTVIEAGASAEALPQNMGWVCPSTGNSLVVDFAGAGSTLVVEAKVGHSPGRLTTNWVQVTPKTFQPGCDIAVLSVPLCAHVVFRLRNTGNAPATVALATLAVQ
jgi:hypothetical protein